MTISKTLAINNYINCNFSCPCNKEHKANIEVIELSSNAISTLTNILKQLQLQKPFFLYDQTTFSLLGKELEDIMQNNHLPFSSYIINDTCPVPDEKTIGKVLINFDTRCDALIAVGSGTINDISRLISYKLQRKYIIIATAPSMDGFTSNVAPLIVNNMKTTYNATLPAAVIGDDDILKNAPMDMISAGIGDILGKYTSLCDWRIASMITGEYYCKDIANLVNHSIETVVSNVDGASKRDSGAIHSIMEALVLSGIAMSYAGNSRPASGSEHHLSHYWEMMFLFQNKKQILHGTKVGIGTIAILKAYEILGNMEIDFEYALSNSKKYSTDAWKSNWKSQMIETYDKAHESVIKLEEETRKNQSENVHHRLNVLKTNWPTIKTIMDELPTADSIYEILGQLHAPNNPVTLDISKEMFVDSFIVAKELRNRYGLLQMLFDLGISEEIGLMVWDYFHTKV